MVVFGRLAAPPGAFVGGVLWLLFRPRSLVCRRRSGSLRCRAAVSPGCSLARLLSRVALRSWPRVARRVGRSQFCRRPPRACGLSGPRPRRRPCLRPCLRGPGAARRCAPGLGSSPRCARPPVFLSLGGVLWLFSLNLGSSWCPGARAFSAARVGASPSAPCFRAASRRGERACRVCSPAGRRRACDGRPAAGWRAGRSRLSVAPSPRCRSGSAPALAAGRACGRGACRAPRRGAGARCVVFRFARGRLRFGRPARWARRPRRPWLRLRRNLRFSSLGVSCGCFLCLCCRAVFPGAFFCSPRRSLLARAVRPGLAVAGAGGAGPHLVFRLVRRGGAPAPAGRGRAPGRGAARRRARRGRAAARGVGWLVAVGAGVGALRAGRAARIDLRRDCAKHHGVMNKLSCCLM